MFKTNKNKCVIVPEVRPVAVQHYGVVLLHNCLNIPSFKPYYTVTWNRNLPFSVYKSFINQKLCHNVPSLEKFMSRFERFMSHMISCKCQMQRGRRSGQWKWKYILHFTANGAERNPRLRWVVKPRHHYYYELLPLFLKCESQFVPVDCWGEEQSQWP